MPQNIQKAEIDGTAARFHEQIEQSCQAHKAGGEKVSGSQGPQEMISTPPIYFHPQTHPSIHQALPLALFITHQLTSLVAGKNLRMPQD